MATQQGGAEIMEDKCPTITASAGMSGNNQPVVCLKDQAITFEPGIAQREGGHIYEGVCGTLRANAGDNRMAVAYDGATPAIGFDGYNAAETGDKAATLGVNCGMSTGRNGVVVGFDAYNQAVTGDVSMSMTARSSDAHHVPVVVTDKPIGFDDYNFEVTGEKTCTLRAGASGGACGVSVGQPVYYVENHPADSRVSLDESGKVQTLTSRMGTGGGNVPMVMEPVTFDARGNGNGKVVSTITGVHESFISDYTSVVCYCLQDKSIGRKEANSCHGLGVAEETSYTLTGVDRHAVVYAVDQGGGKSSCSVTEDTAPTLTATHDGSPAVAYGFDPGASRDVGDLWFEEQSKTLTNGTCPGHHNGVVTYWDGGQTAGTLTANNAGGNQRMPDKENFNAVIENRPHRYIVRRLTPTECARLQGFPDNWGHLDIKEKFTKEEYEFWLDIRNTHAIINGKATKQYTKEQMLSWYNKLHTDGAEYKMWGNGIALPNALYVMQGIADVMEGRNG
jgi:DNA (cytosine-5)-methyltransferase 1